MATLDQVMTALVQGITGTITGISDADGLPVQANVAEQWPNEQQLEAVPNGLNQVAVVIPQSVNKQPWMSFRRATTVTAAGITSTLSNGLLLPTGTVTLTIGGTPALGDSVSLNAMNLLADAAVYVSQPGDTTASIAAGLAAAINAAAPAANARPLLPNWISASATGSVITITNLTEGPFNLSSNVANLAKIFKTVGVACRYVQIRIWANSINARYALSNNIESYITNFESRWNFALATGENAKLHLTGGKEGDADQQKDVYDWILLVEAEHFVDAQLIGYAVLAPLVTLSANEGSTLQVF